MSKIDKLFEKFKRKPVPSDIPFAQADKLLAYHDFERRPPKRGSHYIYTHRKDRTIYVNVPKGRGKLKKAYIKNIVEAIEKTKDSKKGN